MAQLECPECGSGKVRGDLPGSSGCDVLFAVLVGIPLILLGWMNQWWLLVVTGLLFTVMGLVSVTYSKEQPERFNRVMVCADCGHKWLMNEQEYQELAARPHHS